MANAYCCVPMCNSWKKRQPGLSFFKFPCDNSKVKVKNKFNSTDLVDRRKLWIDVLKIGKKVSPFMKVCSLHFNGEDFLRARGVRVDNRRLLKKTAVPTQNLPVTARTEEPGPSNRKHRLSLRNRNKDAADIPIDTNFCVKNVEDEDSVADEDIEIANILLSFNSNENMNQPKTFRDFQVQVNTPENLTLCHFINDDKSLTR